jgi:hypothetical protein
VVEARLDGPVRQLLEGKNFVYIASLMKDGSPHVTPIWVDVEDGAILINTAMGRVKQKIFHAIIE